MSSLSETSEVHLLVPDVRCAGCCLAIEREVGALGGIENLNVNFAEKRLSFTAQGPEARQQVMEKLVAMGYPAVPDAGGEALEMFRLQKRQLLSRLGVAGIGMMQVMTFAFTDYLAGPEGVDPAFDALMRWAAMTVAIPVTFYSAMPFHQGALRDIRNRTPGMDVPVSLAILSAFMLSVLHTLNGEGEVWFDSACMFTFFLLSGRYLELSARQNFQVARSLGEHLLPETARLAGQVLTLDQLVPGQVVFVKAGEAVPADSIVQQGVAAVDESAFTGEAALQTRGVGTRLLAGSRLVEGEVQTRVTAVRSDWVITHLSDAYKEAAAFKPDFAILADRIARYFVLLVLGLALLTGLFWWFQASEDFYAIALSVLVVSCPCALSLATPVAYSIATGAVRQLGVLLDKGAFLETLGQMTAVIFDKTGTLTQGTMQLVEVRVLDEHFTEAEVTDLAASIERESWHPVAVSLRDRAAGLHEVTNLSSEAGQGVSGDIEGQTWKVGKPGFIEPGLVPPDRAANWVALARAGQVVAWFRFADDLREGAAATLHKLRDQGRELWVYSGDSSAEGRAQVLALNLSDEYMGVTPEAKIEGVRRLQNAGQRVLMVGDGLNDAGALAAADLSLAVNPVDAVVQSAADASLVRGNLEDIPALFSYAGRVHAIVRQNLVWACVYNLSVIPLAIAGLVPPWLAALGMSTSSLLVTLNACRLARVV